MLHMAGWLLAENSRNKCQLEHATSLFEQGIQLVMYFESKVVQLDIDVEAAENGNTLSLLIAS